MMIAREKQSIRTWVKNLRRQNPAARIGFVPTMGFLHDGHRSLMKAARVENEYVVVSLFVNPTQFGPGEDFDRYPRDEARDIQICAEENIDCIFAPEVASMYSPVPLTLVSVSTLTDPLCGAYRPGHFDGVTTVVAKLFNLIQPDQAYFGQKDAQQALVIQKMTDDLDFPVRIVICPTVREPDGLAMSSRNVRLSPAGRRIAPVIHQALMAADRLARSGETDVRTIIRNAREVILKHPEMSIQYMECRDRENLQEMDTLDRPALLATAVYLESVRLIDNLFLEPAGENP